MLVTAGPDSNNISQKHKSQVMYKKLTSMLYVNEAIKLLLSFCSLNRTDSNTFLYVQRKEVLKQITL
jgi:hypothetical protein